MDRISCGLPRYKPAKSPLQSQELRGTHEGCRRHRNAHLERFAGSKPYVIVNLGNSCEQRRMNPVTSALAEKLTGAMLAVEGAECALWTSQWWLCGMTRWSCAIAIVRAVEEHRGSRIHVRSAWAQWPLRRRNERCVCWIIQNECSAEIRENVLCIAVTQIAQKVSKGYLESGAVGSTAQQTWTSLLLGFNFAIVSGALKWIIKLIIE